MKKTILSFLLPLASLGLLSAQQWSGPSNLINDVYRDGNVGIGIQFPLAKLDVRETTPLTNNAGDYNILSRIAGDCGGDALVRNTWLTRYAPGPGWYNSVNMIDGISTDQNYGMPTSNVAGLMPKTWWSRDPSWGVQMWGNDEKPEMRLHNGRLIVSGDLTTPVTGRLQVEEAVAYVGSVPTRAFVARTDHNIGTAYAIVADVNHPGTNAFVVNNRNFFATGQSAESFRVTGDGQMTLYSKLPDDFAQTGPNAPQPVIIVRDATPQPTGYTDFFRVYKNGKTIIGGQTNWGANNKAMLTVDGKIVSREVIVTQTGWADFVFDKDYRLMPLNELETFYKNNHHLPDVPTTNEVLENGNDMGKTDALLLQKIEELTLYVVEQQKEINHLKELIKKSN